MIDLDYLKVGSYFVSHFVRSDLKHKDSAWDFHVWHINTVKINKKSIWLNDIKYQISENEIYRKSSGYYETISPVTKEIQDLLNNSLAKELERLEKNYTLVKKLAEKARYVKECGDLIEKKEMTQKLKQDNPKIKVNGS